MCKAVSRLIGWVVLLALVSGCQGRSITNWWYERQDPEYRMLLQSVDEYARKNGLTREQAIRELRERADHDALQQGGLEMPSAPLAGPVGEGVGSGPAQASWVPLPAQPRPSTEVGQKPFSVSTSRRGI